MVIWYFLHHATTPSKGTRNRPFYLGSAFKKMGHQAYVIAANSHHYLNQEVPIEKVVELDESEDASYIWVKTPRYSENGLRRIYNMFYYVYAVWRHAKKIVALTGKPDVIIVSSPHSFTYPVAKRLAKKYNAKLIFEVRDLWPMALIQVNHHLKYNPLTLLMSWIEKKACREANYIVSLLPNAFSYLQTRGLDKSRYAYIPNGFGINQNIVHKPCPTEISEVLADLKRKNKFIVGYLGTHGVFNALERLIDALRILEQRKDARIHVVLAGSGVNKEQLKKQAAGLKNITFFDSIHANCAQDFLAQMDAFFIGWHPLPIYHYGISPDKIFNYMLAGKPIIHAIDTIHDPTQMAKCALVVPTGAPELLANALHKAANLPKEELLAMGARGREYVLSNHDYSILAEQYATLF